MQLLTTGESLGMHPAPAPVISNLRPLLRKLGLTLTLQNAAEHLNIGRHTSRVSNAARAETTTSSESTGDGWLSKNACPLLGDVVPEVLNGPGKDM